MKKFTALIFTSILLSSCSTGVATDALQKAGYTNIHITTYRLFVCANNESYHTGFVANDSTGKQITGTVCSDFLKKTSIHPD